MPSSRIGYMISLTVFDRLSFLVVMVVQPLTLH
jgi:hypothetical protein